MPVPFALLAAAIPGAIQLGQTLINKPKKDDFKPNTAGMDKYLAYLKGKSASSEVAHQVMQPQLKAIGAQNRRTGRAVDQAVAKGGLGAAEEAQLRISQGQQATSALQTVGEQVTIAQTQENRRIGEQVSRIELQIAQAHEQGKLDFERATKDYTKNIQGSVLNIGGAVASAGIGAHLNKMATSKSAFDAAKASGIDQFGSAEELAKASVEAGFTDSRQFVNMLGNREKQVQALGQYGKGEIDALLGEGFDVQSKIRSGELGADKIQKLFTDLGEQRTNTIMDVSTKISNNEITSVDQIKSLNLSDPVKLQLANQLSQQKASLASPTDRAIGSAIQSSDKAGLVKVMETPGISEKDYKTALNAHSSIVSAEIKAENAASEALVKRLKLGSGKENQIKQYSSSAGTLKAVVSTDDKFFAKVAAIRDGTGITNAQQDDLLKDAKVFADNLGNLITADKTDLSAETRVILELLNLDKNAEKKQIFSELKRLIGSMRSNSVVLNAEQQALKDSGVDVAEFDSLF